MTLFLEQIEDNIKAVEGAAGAMLAIATEAVSNAVLAFNEIETASGVEIAVVMAELKNVDKIKLILKQMEDKMKAELAIATQAAAGAMDAIATEAATCAMVKATSNEAQTACGVDVAVMAAKFENVDNPFFVKDCFGSYMYCKDRSGELVLRWFNFDKPKPACTAEKQSENCHTGVYAKHFLSNFASTNFDTPKPSCTAAHLSCKHHGGKKDKLHPYGMWQRSKKTNRLVRNASKPSHVVRKFKRKPRMFQHLDLDWPSVLSL